MLTKPAIKKMIANWKEIYELYKDKIHANCKSVEQILDYLNSKYTVSKLNMYEGNQLYSIDRDDNSEALYNEQDDVFKDSERIIFFFNDYPTKGFCNVQGSSMLWNEVLAYRGLNEDDIKNYYLVAEYIQCLKKYDKDNPLLKK